MHCFSFIYAANTVFWGSCVKCINLTKTCTNMQSPRKCLTAACNLLEDYDGKNHPACKSSVAFYLFLCIRNSYSLAGKCKINWGVSRMAVLQVGLLKHRNLWSVLKKKKGNFEWNVICHVIKHIFHCLLKRLPLLLELVGLQRSSRRNCTPSFS